MNTPRYGTAASGFGRLLAYERKRAGLTQQQLADGLFLGSSESVSRYERGEREPRLSTVVSFAAALGVSPRALVPQARGLASEDSGALWLQIEEILRRDGRFGDVQLGLVQDFMQSLVSRLGERPIDRVDEAP